MAPLIACPDGACGAPAEVVERFALWSTSGPVEHVKTRCARGHVFTPPVDLLPAPAARELASAARSR
jgi:hypothetical protein